MQDSQLPLETGLLLFAFSLPFLVDFASAGICGGKCVCPGGLVVNCTNAGVKFIPPNEDPGIEQLLLARNDVTSVASADLDYDRLVTLDLSYQAAELNLRRKPFKGLRSLKTLKFHATNFNKLEAEHFTGLQTLEELDLSRTNVRHFVDPKLFENLVNLKLLSLAENKLDRLESGVFYGLTQLESLNLNNNRLKTVPLLATSFKLKSLSLRGNQIATLSDSSFEGLQNLKSLALDNNPLTTIDDSVFGNCPKLTSISMRHTHLTTVPHRVFSPLPDLTYLDLSGSKVTVITHHAFQGYPKLSTLRFSDNLKLVSIESFAFQNLPLLATLDLSGNVELSNVDPNWIDGVPKLAKLSVEDCDLESLPVANLGPKTVLHASNNPWSCTCENSDLAEFCSRQKEPCEAICASPENFAKRAISDLLAEDCTVPKRSEVKSGHLKTVHLVLIVVVPLVFLFVAGVCCFFMRKRIRTCCGKGPASCLCKKSLKKSFFGSCLCKKSSFQSRQPLVTVANWRKKDRNSTLSEPPGEPQAFKVIAEHPVPITEL